MVPTHSPKPPGRSAALLLSAAVPVTQFSRFCNRLTEYGLLGLGTLMTLVVVSQVFCRYILNSSLFWSEELARYLLVWLTFLGTTVAYWRGLHPGVDLIYSRLGSKARLLNRLAIHLLCLFFFAIIIRYGVEFAYFVRMQTTPALALPKWIIFSIIPVSGALLSLHGIGMLLYELCPRQVQDEINQRLRNG